MSMDQANGTEAHVQVAVRARPLNQREIDLKSPIIVDIHGSQILVDKSQDKHHTPKTFSYDFCFDSTHLNNSSYASQEFIFNKLGLEIVKHAFEGYNACIFAYGQTGSGKSYTMMGSHHDRGIIPRLCQSMFDRIENELNQDINHDMDIESIDNEKIHDILSLKFSSTYRVEVSYFEIYNEKVRDLLNPNNNHHALKVRENKILGPYVDGLSQLVVTSYQEIETLLIEGNNFRTVASTNMNNESSRSHAVFTLKLTQTLSTDASETQSVKVSKISLVDLAGSERVSKSGVQIEQTRFREGCNINKSLSTLGLVISTLATRPSHDNHSKSTKKTFVPYRDSVLTWLLKDSLGGNSFTIMLATISPAYDNYEETISTLRYADQAKRIVNHAVINEDEPGKIIRELRNEIDILRKELADAKAEKSAEKLNAEIKENENLMRTISKDWQERIAETDKISKERHELLEKSGISVYSSGIGLEKDRLYLVNLNPDPALNELLVYYLKTTTSIGRPDASVKQDIELIGVGISPEHCIIEIRNSIQVFLLPINNSRTYVNGQLIDNERQLRHGDRILLGCSHFFRLNAPGDKNATNSSSVLTSIMNTSSHLSFTDAQNEFLLNQLATDPMTKELRLFLKQDDNNQESNHIIPKKTSDVYEREIEYLKSQLMRSESRSSIINARTCAFEESLSKWRFSNKLLTESEESRSFFNRLKQELIRVNALVSEANTIASEMQLQTTYSVMLQIPASYLKPSERAATNLCEPAVQIKRRNLSPQIWNIEKFESKLNDMRDVYYEWQMSENKTQLLSQQQKRNDPFFDVEEYNSLIGVANIFLKALFYDSKLDYPVPIINTQGEISGSLHVVLLQVGTSSMKKLSDFQQHNVPRASISEGIIIDNNDNSLSEHSDSQNSFDDESIDDSASLSNNTTDQITVKFIIKEARDLPPSEAEYAMCRYRFVNQKEDQTVLSIKQVPNNQDDAEKKPRIFLFNHEKEFILTITGNFISTCFESAISIEVWYRYNSIPLSINTAANNERSRRDAEIRALSNRWKEVKRHIQYAVEIHELDASGRWEPVEVDSQQSQIVSGGVYRLRQGQSKRLVARLRVLPQSGAMPLVLHAIRSVEIGSISTRKINAPRQLDSYQDEELQCLRHEWLDLIEKRKLYLESEVKMLSEQTNKTSNDLERETTLLEQLVRLAEERNFAEFPPPGSGIPGSPPCWTPPQTIEEHRPLIFLNLDPVNMNTEDDTAGLKATLSEENKNDMFRLPLLHHASDEVRAVAQWDPSIHEATEMNRVTPSNTIIYMVVKIIVLISQPVRMELILRKRIATTIGKTEGWWSGKAMKYLLGYKPFKRTSVVYEIVSSIPKYIHEIEDRQSLALIAGSECHSQNYVQKYIQYASAVDSLLLLDKLRQEVSLAETSTKQQQTIRKATSVPNIANQQGNTSLSIAPVNSRRETDDEQSPLKKSPSIQNESPNRQNPFYEDNKALKSSFLYPHVHNETTTPAQIKTINTPFSAFSRSELNVSTPMSTRIDNIKHNETQHSYFESTTPSKLSRSLFIEQEQLQPIQTSSIRMRQAFDIDDHETENNKKQDNDQALLSVSTLEEKYSIATTPQRIESSSASKSDQITEPTIKKIVDINDDAYPIACRVIVNTDHHIFNKIGTIRFVGKTYFKEGTWYGIELEEPVGKNNGSFAGHSYFQCPDKHGIFVRRDKIRRMVDK
ncbi:unnamed protein product [Rotaria socialis]|uniref:Kinesin-like protein KIF13A n=1 Tax=Rotaria socialis TaxID=392032 RepID=A0A818A810_9BILA|nr:unnamed protein product [Rotaria socialis]CAF3401794.1 unnamed protein product [Rotaria socialis]CAF3594722.1 unnamed protein product [Rotaria socialis]CAF3804183.1 unnamed protein product [Rotaria socialis]CAF4167398.1 unnamed protein product [Rotaria socialis]